MRTHLRSLVSGLFWESSCLIEELIVLSALKFEKDNFQELNYVINIKNKFGKQICVLKSVMPWVELRKNLVNFSFIKDKDACSCFYVGVLYSGMQMEFFQQGENNIDLRKSMF